ncbi:unnamed protein product [Caenorhabditis angaria]|uniref:Uncharacterized protein n=1 Tax=Caenorhabditis angaria TaxID=860376 RepID=A0A9P1I7R9_9PELO|nr:unnamed protein product [Caenorhabditis angaria]
MSAETICEAKLQVEILDLQDEITYLKSHNVISVDENQEITSELANVKKQMEESKKHALEDQKDAHIEEMQNLRNNLYRDTMEFIVSELTAAGVPPAQFIGKLEKMENDLGGILKVNLNLNPNQDVPIRTLRRRFSQDIAAKNQILYEERKTERQHERKKRHGDMLCADQCFRDENREKRLKLEKLIEDMEEAERNKEYYFENESPDSPNCIEVETSE